jgi:bifunctional lysine-specific demethylase and histidyl-hydroxylase NO66
MTTRFADAVAALDPVALAEERASDFLSGQTPVLPGGLADRIALPGLGDHSVLERRPTAACVLRPGPDRLLALLGDRTLRMPLRLQAPMEYVAAHERFAVADLAPWLDAGSRLVLARRLVREGLLRVSVP